MRNILREHPAKGHNLKSHGNREKGAADSGLTRGQELAASKWASDDTEAFVISGGPAKGTLIIKSGGMMVRVTADGKENEVPKKFHPNMQALIDAGATNKVSVHKSMGSSSTPPTSQTKDVRIAGMGTFQVRRTGKKSEYYDQSSDSWKRSSGRTAAHRGPL